MPAQYMGGTTVNANLLGLYAREFATDQGFVIGPDFESALVAGVQPELASDRTQSARDAVRNVELIVLTAIHSVGAPAGNLDSYAFQTTLSKLCPIWPICR